MQQHHEDAGNAHMSDASTSPAFAVAAGAAATPARTSPRTAHSLSSSSSASSTSSASSASSPSPPLALAQSARMREAQSLFQRVVKQELQVLLARGVERDVAVRKLLHRIVASTQAPEAADVRRVMKQFQMNYDDAVRALIVKQEIGRLKRQGMDAFAAIEELTRKMQRAGERGGEEARDENVQRASDRSPGHDGSVSDPAYSEGVESSSGSASSPDADVDLEEEEEEKRERQEEDAALSEKDQTEAATVQAADEEAASAPAAAAEAAPPTTSLSPLSLCQRIDNVSISSEPSSKFVGVPSPSPTTSSLQVDVSAVNADAATESIGANSRELPVSSRTGSNSEGLESPRSRSPTSSSSSPALVSRKRRAAPPGIDSKVGSLHHQQQHHHHHTGPSTFPLFPSSKKQKLMEVGDGYLSVVSRKYAKAPLSPSDSPVATTPSTSTQKSSSTSGASNNSSSSTGGSAANPHKRRRESASRSPGYEYPVTDDDDELTAAAHIVRITKRHKSHTTQVKVASAPVAATANVAEIRAGGESSDNEHEGPASS